MQPFKIRASAIGKIMTEPQTVSPQQQYHDAIAEIKRLQELQSEVKNLNTKVAQNRAEKIKILDTETIPYLQVHQNDLHLSETYKSYLHTWLKEQIYDRKKEFTSKYTEKGNLCEDDAIEFAGEQLGWGMVSKNTEHFSNEYITGTPDVILAKSVDDIKCVWDCFTFPVFDFEEANKDYEWQGIGYMDLVKRERFGLHYCLMDAPETLIESEARKLSYKAGFDELDAEFYEQVKASMLYSHLAPGLRLKSYLYNQNTVAVHSVYDRVELGRKYLASLDIAKYV